MPAADNDQAQGSTWPSHSFTRQRCTEHLPCTRPIPQFKDEEKNKTGFPAFGRTLPIWGDRHRNKQLHCNVITARTERLTASCGNAEEALVPSGGAWAGTREKQQLARVRGSQKSQPDKEE